MTILKVRISAENDTTLNLEIPMNDAVGYATTIKNLEKVRNEEELECGNYIDNLRDVFIQICNKNTQGLIFKKEDIQQLTDDRILRELSCFVSGVEDVLTRVVNQHE